MEKIIIIGSSMAMPRLEVSIEDTWPYLLNQSLDNHYLINLCRRASTSERFKAEREDILEFYDADKVIIQIGITDCAPHYFSRNMARVLSRLPDFLSSPIFKFKRSYSKRKKSNCYVNIGEFKRNYEDYIKRSVKDNVKKIIIILIAQPSKSFSIKSPYIQQQIDEYNKVLNELASKYESVVCLCPFDENIDEYYIDDFHVNDVGHKLLCEQLLIELG